LVKVGNEAPVGIGEIGTNCGNRAPVITVPGNQLYYEGSLVSLQIEASDPDIGDVITYSESGLPTSLTINSSTGLISGTLDASANTYPVTVTVTDQEGLFSSISFDIVINNGTPTIVSPISDLTRVVNSGDLVLDLTTVFDDNDGVGGLTYTIENISNSTLVSGTDISSGILTVMLAVDETGSSDITVRATDGNLLFVEDIFAITVVDVPVGIVLEGECGDVGSDWSVISDPDASGGSYVVSETFSSKSVVPSIPSGVVSFNFDVSEGSDYELYARVKAPGSGNNSFWVRVNGGSWIFWGNMTIGSQYNWNEVKNSPFSLAAGANLIEFGYREKGAQLDKLHLVKVGNEAPVGIGEIGTNCGSPTPEPNMNDLTNVVNNTNSDSIKNTSLDQSIKINVYPNPVHQQLNVAFELKEKAFVSIIISDLLGRTFILGDRKLRKGKSELSFNLTRFNLKMGTYYLRIQSNGSNLKIFKLYKE
jgi:hypothetical protein